MAEETADFVTILSSELIAEVVEAYFNNVMYKVSVKVVDLKPTADGYAFSLAFDSKKEVKSLTFDDIPKIKIESIEDSVNKKLMRSKNGKFVPKNTATTAVKE